MCLVIRHNALAHQDCNFPWTLGALLSQETPLWSHTSSDPASVHSHYESCTVPYHSS